jgi:arginyl-tRNA synthetase
MFSCKICWRLDLKVRARVQIFAAARKAGYMPTDRDVRIDHVGFGLVMGDDNKKFRSRSGDVSNKHSLIILFARSVAHIKW